MDHAAASAQRLGVPINASPARLRAAFHVQALRWHPDRNSDPEALNRFREVQEAYRTLVNVQTQAHELDIDSAIVRAQCGGCVRNDVPLIMTKVIRVHSRLLFSKTAASHRLLCVHCAQHALLLSSALSGATGMWSLTGPVSVIAAAWQNGRAKAQHQRVNLRFALHGVAPATRGSGQRTSAFGFGVLNLLAALAVPVVVIALLIQPFG